MAAHRPAGGEELPRLLGRDAGERGEPRLSFTFGSVREVGLRAGDAAQRRVARGEDQPRAQALRPEIPSACAQVVKEAPARGRRVRHDRAEARADVPEPEREQESRGNQREGGHARGGSR